MKKITTLIAFMVIAAFAIGQVYMDYKPTKLNNVFSKESVKLDSKDEQIYWSVDFEEEEPVWSFGWDVGTKSWHVTDQAGAPETWEPVPGSYYLQYLGLNSLTGNDVDGKWAWVDIISDFPQLGGSGQELCNTWIQFDNIDLSEVDNPKLIFYQGLRPLNQMATYLDFSIDGGETWTTKRINEGVEGNTYAPLVFDIFIGEWVANEANVSIRFRWETISVASVVGYGWQIDDIKIVDNPVYDLSIYESRMNFVDYIDYTVVGQEDYYHISSHYGQIPADQYNSPFALSWFNVAVENKGVETVTAKLNVKVLDPNDDVIFDEVVTGRTLAITEKDTIDMIEVDFALGTDPLKGKYTVAYYVFIEGEEDERPDDNVDTAVFYVTDFTFGRDAQNVTGTVGPGNWLNGGNDGDMIGTDYLYLFEEEIKSMDVYISTRTDPGTSLIARIMQFDATSEQWVDISTSTLIDIEEEHLGEWMNITFIDPAIVSFEAGDDAKTIRAALEFYYNGDNDVFIGFDGSNQHSFWGTVWFFTQGDNANSWFSISNWAQGGLCIRLNTGEEFFPVEFSVVGENGTIAATANGTAITSGDEVVGGSSLEFTATPVSGYVVKEWKLNDEVQENTTNTLSVNNLTEAVNVTVEFMEGNSVDQAFLNNISIYPNPANGVINIENVEGASIEIINLMGQIIETVNNASVLNSIDMSRYASGTYMIRIVLDNNVVTRKFKLEN